MKQTAIDWEDFKERLLEDEEVQNKVLQLFLTMMPKHISNLELVLRKNRANDSHEIERLAQTTKSAALNICATRLAILFQEIEFLGKQGQADKARELFPEALGEFKIVESEIKTRIEKDQIP